MPNFYPEDADHEDIRVPELEKLREDNAKESVRGHAQTGDKPSLLLDLSLENVQQVDFFYFRAENECKQFSGVAVDGGSTQRRHVDGLKEVKQESSAVKLDLLSKLEQQKETEYIDTAWACFCLALCFGGWQLFFEYYMPCFSWFNNCICG